MDSRTELSSLPYIELRCATAFSFLRGASHPEEMVARAGSLGYRRLAITDRDGLYGIVRAQQAGKTHGVEILVGVEINLHADSSEPPEPDRVKARASEPSSLILLPTDRAAYGRLCRLLTTGRRRTGKGSVDLRFDDIVDHHHEGWLAIHVGSPDTNTLVLEKDVFGDRLSLSIERTLSPFDRRRIEACQSASARIGIPLVATGGVLMHHPSRKPLQDILSCIRLGVRLHDAGRRLFPNAHAYLKAPHEMAALFSEMPEVLERSREIADQCSFRLDELRHNFTLELLPPGASPMDYLGKLVEKGAIERYGECVPSEVRAQISHEMKLIEELDFVGYFLTVWDIVRFARSKGILCQGRGSAANSVICYLLGITSIDPVRMNLLFERFISVERGEPPDIDVDFEHERREEVMQYVYDKYGRDHAAMVANVITYRARSAYREVGKVFGLCEDKIDRLNRWRGYWASGAATDEELVAAGIDPKDELVSQVVKWSEVLQGFPRHLGLHSGGFVITREPIIEIVPVENASKELRTVIAWDKNDIEALRFVKVDLLALGMLSAVHRTFDLIRKTESKDLQLSNIPAEIPEVYDMICDADTVGTFQIESRAQMQMLPRLMPRTFYDLVVSVAIVRPGPIQGDMIHPYLRRREGLEPVDYPHPALREILGKTYGIPLFQEQVMKMAVAIAGFTPGEADELRRAIGWHSQIHIDLLRERLVKGMLQNGLEHEYAERVFRMIQGFGGYGFPESHAASFALIGYASAYLKRYHPAAFVTALLNSQPMGFYAPRNLVADAERHGVEVRAPCIMESTYDSTLEESSEEHAACWWASSPQHGVKRHTPYADRMHPADPIRAGHANQVEPTYGLAVQPALRLGLREIAGVSKEHARQIVAARGEGVFSSIANTLQRTGLPRDIAVRMAAAGAFSCLGISRREAMWKIMAIDPRSKLFCGVDAKEESTRLPPMSEVERMQSDYEVMGFSVDLHPIGLLREELARRGLLGSRDLETTPHGARVRIAGMVSTRQRPSTAVGVVFITLEDEHGHMNLVVFSKVFERQRELAHHATMLIAEGKLQRQGKVLNVIVEKFEPLVAPQPTGPVSRNFF